jgi:hypothetical protein
MLFSLGLTTEWHHWFFPIRFLLFSFAFPAIWVSPETPFFSTLKVPAGRPAFHSESDRG